MTERADFLTRIIDRTLERVPVVEPREVSLYETPRSSGMRVEALDVAAEEAVVRGPAERDRRRDAGDAERSPAQLVPREGPAVGEARSRQANAFPPPAAAPPLPVRLAQEAVERSQVAPAQTVVHEVIRESQPALVPRASALLQSSETAEPSVLAAAAAETEESDRRTHDRDDREPSRESRSGRHLLRGQPPQTEALLPKQLLVRDVVARSAAAPREANEPSNAPESHADTVVNVTIGRVEVRAGTPQPKAPPQGRRTDAHRPMSLTEYLQRRGPPR